MAQRTALVTNAYQGLAHFVASLQPLNLIEERDGATRMFVKWCGKLKMPVNAGEPILDNRSEEEMRAVIRGTYICMPAPLCERLPSELLMSMDALLAEELSNAAVIDPQELPVVAPNVCIWQGDMSVLAAEAVVNPANGVLLGCFLPTHKCLDNILHAQSGPRLRIACAEMKRQQNIDDDDNGQCRVTEAFSLPSKYVFHTVGPNLVEYTRKGQPKPPRAPTPVDRAELTSCYVKCLDTAQQLGVKSIAFCCISTGVFGYPSDEAATIAMTITRDWLAKQEKDGKGVPLVIFNVFLDKDLDVYQKAAPAVFGSV